MSQSILSPYNSGNLVPIKAKLSFQDSQCDSLDLKIKSMVMDNMCNEILHRNQKNFINVNTIDLIAMDKEVKKFQNRKEKQFKPKILSKKIKWCYKHHIKSKNN